MCCSHTPFSSAVVENVTFTIFRDGLQDLLLLSFSSQHSFVPYIDRHKCEQHIRKQQILNRTTAQSISMQMMANGSLIGERTRKNASV